MELLDKFHEKRLDNCIDKYRNTRHNIQVVAREHQVANSASIYSVEIEFPGKTMVYHHRLSMLYDKLLQASNPTSGLKTIVYRKAREAHKKLLKEGFASHLSSEYNI